MGVIYIVYMHMSIDRGISILSISSAFLFLLYFSFSLSLVIHCFFFSHILHQNKFIVDFFLSSSSLTHLPLKPPPSPSFSLSLPLLPSPSSSSSLCFLLPLPPSPSSSPSFLLFLLPSFLLRLRLVESFASSPRLF